MKIARQKNVLLWLYINRFPSCLIISILLFLTTSVAAQDISNSHLEKVQEEGLFCDHIFCINQDTNGFIWFGTKEGLFRYDGYSYKAFRSIPGDPTTLISNNILSLYPDKNYLWVGTIGGLSRINLNTQIVTNFPAHEFLQINCLLTKNDSVLWVGTATGLFEFNKETLQWKRRAAFGKNAFIYSICDDQKGHLYVSALNGFYCYTKSTATCKFYQPNLPTYPLHDKSSNIAYRKAMLDNHGDLWLGTWDAGLVRFDTKTENVKAWSYQTEDVHFIPYKIITDLLSDDNGNIWIANKEGGLTIYNPSGDKFTNYPVEWGSESNLSNSVISLFRDRCGIVWIGTENGIYKYDPHQVYLSRTDMLIKTGKGVEPSHLSPISMLKDKDGVWWMGTYGGLYAFDPKTGILSDCNSRFGIPETSAVFSIIQDTNGTIWLTAKNTLVKITKKANLQKTSLQAQTFKSADIPSSMCSMYIDHENRIWIGTHSNGVYRFDAGSDKFISYDFNDIGPRFKIKEIRTFCELSKDSILVAGENTGLYLLHANTFVFEKIDWSNEKAFEINPTISTLYKNGKDIWMGTEYNGLWKTDTHLAKPVIITVNDGLPSMDVQFVRADNYNNLWLLTGAGVVKYETPDKKITIFEKKEGIRDLSELYAMLIDKQGNISVGSEGVVYNFNADNILKNKKPPEVLITDIKIFDKNYNINKGETIKLHYNQNYFSFDYVALSYTQSRFNKYAYKMVGLDKKWNYAGTHRYASYANLDEGTYTFYVKACNSDGVWSTVPAKLILIITPPFWHRWWFYTLIILLILGIIFIVYTYNINQIKMRVQLRDQIARDLHDDIGSTLSGINIFSNIALQKINSDQQGSAELLKKISERSEKTLDALSDIVWSINTRNDGLDNFLIKAREYLYEVLEARGIAYELHVDKEMEHLKTGMAARKEVYLIFKEAVYNASKYAHCRLIKISLIRDKDTCKLTVCDDGIGFDLNNIPPGNGIYNMKHRAKKINALLNIESAENEGTCVTLNFHIPRFR